MMKIMMMMKLVQLQGIHDASWLPIKDADDCSAQCALHIAHCTLHTAHFVQCHVCRTGMVMGMPEMRNDADNAQFAHI